MTATEQCPKRARRKKAEDIRTGSSCMCHPMTRPLKHWHLRSQDPGWKKQGISGSRSRIRGKGREWIIISAFPHCIWSRIVSYVCATDGYMQDHDDEGKLQEEVEFQIELFLSWVKLSWVELTLISILILILTLIQVGTMDRWMDGSLTRSLTHFIRTFTHSLTHYEN